MHIVHSFDDKRPFENSVLLLQNLDQREDSTSYSLEILSVNVRLFLQFIPFENLPQYFDHKSLSLVHFLDPKK